MLYTDMYFDYLATRLGSFSLLGYITAFGRCVRRPRCYYSCRLDATQRYFTHVTGETS